MPETAKLAHAIPVRNLAKHRTTPISRWGLQCCPEMILTLQSIEAADDEQLFQLISEALENLFSGSVGKDPETLLAALDAAPLGLRAMAGIHDLDVSMALDDLAYHFGNHNDERFLRETAAGLKELEAFEAAEIFVSAWEIVKPFLVEIRENGPRITDFDTYLQKTGIQARVDPLNERMWAICKKCGPNGLLQYWLEYARKYPQRCLKPS